MPAIKVELRATNNTTLESLTLTAGQVERVQATLGRSLHEDDSRASAAEVLTWLKRQLRGLALQDAVRDVQDRSAAANETLRSEGW